MDSKSKNKRLKSNTPPHFLQNQFQIIEIKKLTKISEATIPDLEQALLITKDPIHSTEEDHKEEEEETEISEATEEEIIEDE